MRKYFWGILLIAGLASACRKSVTTPASIASFTVDGDTVTTLSLATYDSYSLINNSINFDSCRWDFGNDSIYHSNEVNLYYPRSGNYTLTLTVFSAGKRSVMTKQISVYDRVLRSVVINSLNMNNIYFQQSGYPVFGKVNAWVGIQQTAARQSYSVLSDGTFDAPFAYKSPVQQNVDSTNAPITISVPGKIIIDIPTLSRGYGYQGYGYGFNLYIQSGASTYILYSTFWSGMGSSTTSNAYNADQTLNPNGTYFKIRTGNGLGCEVDFIADYEQ